MIVKVPLHVSGFWVPIIKNDYLLTGSLGAGITLTPYCIVKEVSHGQHRSSGLLTKGANIVDAVAKYLNVEPNITIEMLTNVELGEGYGLSAVLALGYAIFLLKKKHGYVSIIQASRAAHFAEVFNMTGLGDVTAEVLGKGLTVRLKPGPPGIGEVDCIIIKEKLRVATVHLGHKLFTPQMLRNYHDKIVRAGWSAYNDFIKEYNLCSFIDKSHKFSKAVGFLTPDLDNELKEQLRHFISNGSVLGYFIKKSLLVVLHDSSISDELTYILRRYGTVKLFNPAPSGLNIYY